MAGSELQFGRRARLTLGETQVEGLRISFKIDRTDEPTPDTAEISVWNLAETTREGLTSSRSLPVTLEAGYGTLQLLFLGDIMENGVTTARKGPDWITTLRTGDGLSCHRTNRVTHNIPKGMPINQAVVGLLQKMSGVDVTNAIAQVNAGLPGLVSARPSYNGTVLQGSALQELNKFVRAFGYRVIVVHGKVEFHQITGTYSDGTVPSLSPTSGLLGAPVATQDGFIQFRCFLRPEIAPKRQVQVIWSQVPLGLFIVARKITHTGDTRSAEWYTEVEGSKKS